jgi:putative endopeptidase
MGYKVDGNRTLSENIADLAAMKAMVSIAESRGATNEDFKNLFEAYANLWVMKSTSEYAELLSLEDTHSPNKVRVNAVLSSIDKFYEVYDITENDKMYVAPENRVGLW